MQTDSKLPDSSAAPPTIRCLHCDYDLRGLAGDPVRCPECGQQTSYAQYGTREAQRRRQLTKAGDYSNRVTVIAPLFVLSLIPSFLVVQCAICSTLPLGIVLATLLIAIRREAGGSPGWGWIVVRHQLALLTTVAAILSWAPVFVAIAFGAMILHNQYGIAQPWRVVAGIGLPVIFIAIMIFALLSAERAGQRAVSAYEELNRCTPKRKRQSGE